MNLRFLNFCSKYSSKGTVNHAMSKNACFSAIFQGPRMQHNEYVLELYFNKSVDNDDNNCLLTTEELVQYINEVKKIKSFEHTLEKHDNKFVIKFKLSGPIIYHKFILTWLRYAYEFPYNVVIKETFKVKQINGFKRTSIFNLFNVISASIDYDKHGTDIHCIGHFDDFREIVKYEDLKKKLHKEAKDRWSRLNDLLKVYDKNKFKLVEDDHRNYYNSDYWNQEEEFKKRVKVYKFNLKNLKNI